MNKEELEKEAEKYLDEKCKDCYMCSYDEHKDPYRVCQRRKDRKQAYLAGAEPREKRIAELETRCNELFLQTMQLTKAKEIIKEFVHHYKAKTIYIENMQDLLKQSEQFISEVKK